MSEELFDRAEEYETMLNEGIALSGENQEFFIAGRTKDLSETLPAKPRRILDFGCGVGKTCAHLADVFPQAVVVGADLSERAVAHAEKQYGSARVSFTSIMELQQVEPFDLCYVNGVFHHIQPAERQQTLELIKSVLRPGGYLAVFENNPWNPGARMVMRRIPFDRNAILVSCLELRRRMKLAGYEVLGARFLFYLPRALSALRSIERRLVRLPMGAQYYVLSWVPPASGTPD